MERRTQSIIDDGGMAQTLDLAGMTNTVGAPSFAHFAKGGNHERLRNGFAQKAKTLCQQHPYPPLQKNARTGHPQHRRSRPTSSKAGPPAPVFCGLKTEIDAHGSITLSNPGYHATITSVIDGIQRWNGAFKRC
jgi:hypothetical protein